MTIPLKSEPNSDHMSFACPPSLKLQVEEYAEKHGVKPSAALRHIISLFFSGNCDSIEVKSDFLSENLSKITIQHQQVVTP